MADFIRGFWAAFATGAVLCGGSLVAPHAAQSWRLLAAQEDPAELSALRLFKQFDAETLNDELRQALNSGDVDLAQSFAELAAQQTLQMQPVLAERLTAASGAGESLKRSTSEFYTGALSGDGESGAGIAGVIAADLTGVGDVRDLIREGGKVSRGEQPDRLVLGLAGVGLVITGATIASFGAASPARAGVSTLKAAALTGRLSKPLAAQLTRIVGQSVDMANLGREASAAARLDLSAAREGARSAVRTQPLLRIRGMAEDVTSIGRRAGVRAASQSLALAQDASELRKISRLTAVRGGATRAVLKVLGRSAFAIGSGAALLTGWVMAGVAWMWMGLLLALALVKGALRVAGSAARAGFGAARLAMRAARRLCVAPLTLAGDGATLAPRHGG